MKINFIIPFTGKTGGIKIIFEYANRLSECGHDIVIYVPMRAYRFNNKGIIGKLKTIKSSIGNTFKRGTKVDWFRLNVPVKLVPKINNKYIRDADVVIATAWPTAYDIYNLDDMKGKKYYFIQHYEIWSGKKEEVDNTYKLPLKQIVIAQWLKDLMKNKFKKSNVDIAYNGIDFNEFYNNRKNFNNNIISMMYSRQDWKGYKEGLKAFEGIRDRYPNLKLILFGMEKGDDIPDYADFYLNPSKEELRQIYSASDIFIFPSKFEGWGLTPLEAMACKCAVVGTRVGCFDEIGIHSQNVMLSEPNDTDTMEYNIQQLLDDKQLLRNISEAGYKSVLKFDWNKSVENFEKILRR
ncbi:MAG: glycosyltransferase family 4 protein [Clostridium sp.]|uniref:glycosyltransferase family 4 protein n=1 Tax=Clostridium sp. TaxID=1506 RepID=UPI0025C682DF|nr:glycosyltransferase family 4 protein [Clostridium sp.]MCH3965042.1 glycosyltransferase family 4 protein [Clostridium sp.]MCI1714263.1 glycosyltransferase family 4 protein [Clostridium sp.]MCI1798525.1 glycosyltransferase family 4 protein [Clostridium sp.]MCI1812744.1 glycosyltransferase family 4 protein [Clostridium sp.]MCI1869334.1 glycosyltransferase family 4 protein [Clostridium sp.]